MKPSPDFADWISPMLVKELRQGMRSRFFEICFLLIQVAMIFVAIVGFGASGNHTDTTGATAAFWTITAASLVFIMPMSGLNAVSNERIGNTLELIFLTRLTPRRIIIGKWLAIVAQTLLLVCAILPYAVLRYFLGGIDVAGDLRIITLLLLASVTLSGIAVGLSPHSSRVVRIFLIIGVVIMAQILPRLFSPLGYLLFGGSAAPTTGDRWNIYLSFGWSALLTLSLMIEFGAARIAPLAENHTTTRRLMALAGLAVVAIFGRSFSGYLLWGLTIAVLVPLCIGAMCEAPCLVPSIYRPFVKRGVLGKLAGRFLYPGWPAGVFFCLLPIVTLFAVGLVRAGSSTDLKWIVWAAVTATGALYFPAALLRLFRPRTQRPLAIYMGVQVVCALLVVLAATIYASNGFDFRSSLAAIPTCGLLLTLSRGVLHDADLPGVLTGVSVVTGASLLVLLIKMIEPWRQIKMMEKSAAALPSVSQSHAVESVPAV